MWRGHKFLFYHICLLLWEFNTMYFDLNFIQYIFFNLPHFANLKNTYMNEPKKQTNKQNRCSLFPPLFNTQSFSARWIAYLPLLYILRFHLAGLILPWSTAYCHNCEFICAMSKLQFPCAYPPPCTYTPFSLSSTIITESG